MFTAKLGSTFLSLRSHFTLEASKDIVVQSGRKRKAYMHRIRIDMTSIDNNNNNTAESTGPLPSETTSPSKFCTP